MYKIYDEVIEETMKNCGVELTAGRKSLVEVKIQRGIFQWDALSQLLLVIVMMPLKLTLKKYIHFPSRKKRSITKRTSTTPNCQKWKELEVLIQIVRIYSQVIGMEFGIEKCTMVIMRSRKRQMMEGKELLNQEKIRTLGKRRLTSTWEYWKWTSSNSWRWRNN